MMRAALNKMGGHSEDSVIIGDNMSTDILAGIQAGMETILVLSGYTRAEDIDRFPYRPNHVFPRLADVDVV
jgi:NagD protein